MSTEALTCAINSVAIGEEQACVKQKFSDSEIAVGDSTLSTQNSKPEKDSGQKTQYPSSLRKV